MAAMSSQQHEECQSARQQQYHENELTAASYYAILKPQRGKIAQGGPPPAIGKPVAGAFVLLFTNTISLGPDPS